MTASGMAAISAALLTFLSAGDHLVIPHAVYGGTHDFCAEILSNFGVEITWVNLYFIPGACRTLLSVP